MLAHPALLESSHHTWPGQILYEFICKNAQVQFKLEKVSGKKKSHNVQNVISFCIHLQSFFTFPEGRNCTSVWSLCFYFSISIAALGPPHRYWQWGQLCLIVKGNAPPYLHPTFYWKCRSPHQAGRDEFLFFLMWRKVTVSNCWLSLAKWGKGISKIELCHLLLFVSSLQWMKNHLQLIGIHVYQKVFQRDRNLCLAQAEVSVENPLLLTANSAKKSEHWWD